MSKSQRSTPSSAARERTLAVVARLVTAADGDTLYRDVYVRRAAELLSPIISDRDYEAAIAHRAEVDRLKAQVRAAVGRQEWERVRELGMRAASLQHSLDERQAWLAAAETVHGAPAVALDPLSPRLTAFSRRWSDPAQARDDVRTALAELGREDADGRALYTARHTALEGLDVTRTAGANAAAAAPGAAVDLEQRLLQAVERGDVAALDDLTGSILGKKTALGGDESAAARGHVSVPAALGEPIPGSESRAAPLGLECVEMTLPDPSLASAIYEFMERYAIGAAPVARDRASEGVARLALAAERIHLPHDVVEIFAETVALFTLHLFVNSAGLRYVPVAAPHETVLVETHPEGDEPVTPLLRELGLDRRRALARDDVEAALRRHGARIVGDRLGLDPLAFRLVCIPPDVYVRVGRDRGWGARQEWTHFDGYQVLSGGRLRALVGGHARFGGLFEVCTISHGDARENTLVRFAVVRRERLGVRIG